MELLRWIYIDTNLKSGVMIPGVNARISRCPKSLRVRGASKYWCAPLRRRGFFLLGPRCAGRVGHLLGPLGP
jgi:hypothetical protein